MQYNVRFPWHYGCHKSEGEKENRVRQLLGNCFSIKPKRLAKAWTLQRRVPRNALELSPKHAMAESVSRNSALPSPSTTYSGWSATSSCFTMSAPQRRYFFFRVD